MGVFQFVGKGGIIEAKISVRGNKMKRTRAQIKAEMMKQFEAKVDQLLDWQEKAKRPNLTQFENEILAARKEISVEMMKAMLQGEQAGTPIEAPLCPKCGKVMENKGKRPQVIETRLGTIQVERTYYACPECGEGFFPSG
jgi:YgiT-type zinc finger domain-containing protein